MAAFHQEAAGSGRFESSTAKCGTRKTEPPQAHGDQIVWASGQGAEIATLHGHIGELVVAVRQRMKDGILTEPASFLEAGPESALVVGPPGRTLACLVASEELVPGIVAIIGDAAGDQAKTIRAVERLLGRGFEVHPHAA